MSSAIPPRMTSAAARASAAGANVVLVDTRVGKRSELKDAGAWLWHEVRNGATEAQLVEGLIPRADGSADEARGYVREWLRALRRARLVYAVERGS